MQKCCLSWLAISLLVVAIAVQGYAQGNKKRLPRAINIPDKDAMAPQISADGRYLYYLTNNNLSDQYELWRARKRGGSWGSPEPTKIPIKQGLDPLKAYRVSPNGKTVTLTSRRANGIGGYDIWYTQPAGSTWARAQNFGKPINSKAHEGAATLTADGKTMIFMRCKSMTEQGAAGCKLMMATQQGGRWQKPVALPNHINTGDVRYPQLLADGHSLIFSKQGSQGIDLYMTRLEGQQWSAPQALQYLNTEQDDLQACIPPPGQVAYYDMAFRGRQNIIMARVPDSLQPKPILMLTGQAKAGASVVHPNATVQVYDAHSHQLLTGTRTDQEGNFFLLLPAGKTYDVSIMPGKAAGFWSDVFAMDTAQSSTMQDDRMNIPMLNYGAQWVAGAISFVPNETGLQQTSQLDLLRLRKLLQSNPGLRLEVGVYASRIVTDTVQSSPSLTEVMVDTVWATPGGAGQPIAYTDTDSLGQGDTTMANIVPVVPEAPAYTLKYTYHNDRTEAMAQQVVNSLVNMGIEANRLVPNGYGDKQFRIVYRHNRDYWVGIKVIDL